MFLYFVFKTFSKYYELSFMNSESELKSKKDGYFYVTFDEKHYQKIDDLRRELKIASSMTNEIDFILMNCSKIEKICEKRHNKGKKSTFFEKDTIKNKYDDECAAFSYLYFLKDKKIVKNIDLNPEFVKKNDLDKKVKEKSYSLIAFLKKTGYINTVLFSTIAQLQHTFRRERKLNVLVYDCEEDKDTCFRYNVNAVPYFAIYDYKRNKIAEYNTTKRKYNIIMKFVNDTLDIHRLSGGELDEHAGNIKAANKVFYKFFKDSYKRQFFSEMMTIDDSDFYIHLMKKLVRSKDHEKLLVEMRETINKSLSRISDKTSFIYEDTFKRLNIVKTAISYLPYVTAYSSFSYDDDL